MSIEWKNPLNRMHQPKLNRDHTLRVSNDSVIGGTQTVVEDILPQPESGAICRLPILKHLCDPFLLLPHQQFAPLTTLYMSEFLPAKIETNLPAPLSHASSQPNTKTHTQGHAPALKTSDDAKWRVGVHAMAAQLGPKFSGIQMFCAKDVVENAADGEFRLQPAVKRGFQLL